MRLWVLLDEKVEDKLLQEDDVVFTTWQVEPRNYSCHKTIYFQYHLCDEEEYISECVNDIFDQLPKHYGIYKDSFYMKIMRPIASCLRTVENIINENKIDEVILVGGNEVPFLTTINAEAEGEKKWYKSSWLLNTYIFWFVKNICKIRVRWIQKNNRTICRIKNMIREKCYLYLRFLAEFLKSAKYTNKSNYLDNNGEHNVFICDLPLQYKHLKYISENMISGDNVFILSPNIDIPSVKDQTYITLDRCSSIEKYRILKKCRERSHDMKIVSSLNGVPIVLSFRHIQQALYTVIFGNLIHMACFSGTIRKISNVKSIITDMTFGPYILSLHRYSKKRGIIHKNFQCVSMKKMLFPNLEMADEYYLYSKQTFDLYRKYSPTFKMYLPIYGQPHASEDKELTVTIFLQPDDYSPLYLSILIELLPVLEKNGNVNKIIIKPHYRQDKLELFYALAKKFNKCKFYDKSSLVEDVFRETDIMMSITSSVLFEAVSYGIFGIICDIDGYWHDYIYFGDTCVPEVNVYTNTIDEIVQIINNYDLSFAGYCKRRESYINSFKGI